MGHLVVEIPRTLSDLEALVAEGENEKIEFKAGLPTDDNIASCVSAFANTDGGLLIIGADERQSILGVPAPRVKAVLARLRAVAEAMVGEGFQIKENVFDGKHVVFLKIEPAPGELRPISTAKGESYTRVGASIARIRHAQAIQMLPPIVNRAEAVVMKPGPVTIFVAMSFRDEEEPALVDYFRSMQRAAERTGGKVVLTRIDLVEGDYEISQGLMDEIDNADAVLADFTLSPANVYFELGYARGRRKPIIQTARKGTQLEFDVRNWRTIFYKNATELEERLIDAFQHLVMQRSGDA